MWLIFTSNELKHDTEEAMQHNNIIGYINLTWYKRYSQRKKYHQAINFQTFLHHVCLLWFELRNVFPRYTWWIIDFWSHTKERYQRQIFTNTSQQTQGYLWLHVLFQVLISFSVSVDLFPCVTIMKIETQFLPNNSTAVTANENKNCPVSVQCLPCELFTPHTCLAEFFSVLSLQR